MLDRRTFVASLPVLAGAATVAAGAQPSGVMASYDDVVRLARKPARHKQSFSSTRPNGYVWYYVRNSLNGYEFGWGQGAGALHPVPVFNGLGTIQGLDDGAWSRYRFSDVLAHAGLPLPQPSPSRNPRLHAPPGLPSAATGPNAFTMDQSIESLRSRGMDVIVCNTALQTVAMTVVAAGVASDADAVHADLQHRLVPGAILVPSGVSALDTLHENGFSVFDSNL